MIYNIVGFATLMNQPHVYVSPHPEPSPRLLHLTPPTLWVILPIIVLSALLNALVIYDLFEWAMNLFGLQFLKLLTRK